MPRGHAYRPQSRIRSRAPVTRLVLRCLSAAFLSMALLLPMGTPPGTFATWCSRVPAMASTAPREARASEPDAYQPGFRTLGIWIPKSGERLDVAVWYPSIRAPSEIHLGDWTLDVARGGKEAPGRFPLLVISHCTAGSRLSHHDTAEALARVGFVVAAPTHPGDNSNDTSLLFLPDQLTARPRHISTTISRLLRARETAAMIDPTRIGIIGFGTGGATALLLAGARPDGGGYAGYCDRTPPGDPYCTGWASERLARLPETLRPPQPGTTDSASGDSAPMGDSRIRAAALVAPGYGMLFPHTALTRVTIPVTILKADNDEVNRAPLHADALRAALPRPPEFTVLADADHYALMAACPPAVREELPELCGGVDEGTRHAIHRRLNALLARFFLATLGEAGPFPTTPEPEPAAQSVPPRAAPAVNATLVTNMVKDGKDGKNNMDAAPRTQKTAPAH